MYSNKQLDLIIFFHFSSRTASLASSKTKSNTSIPSIASYSSPSHSISTKQTTSCTSWLGTKTPKSQRKSSSVSQQGKMIKIRCQRFNTEDKTYEEIEVEVPAPIYETIQVYNNDGGSVSSKKSCNDKARRASFCSGRRASFGTRIKNLFTP